MILLLLLPLIPICIYIAKTKTPEEIREMNKGTKKAIKDAAIASAAAAAIVIKDGNN